MATERKSRRARALSAVAVICVIAFVAAPVRARDAQHKYSTDVPSYVTTPNSDKTRIGTLRFKNGARDPGIVKLVYDQLDFSRGKETFLRAISGTPIYAVCACLGQVVVKLNSGTAITEELMNARSLFPTPNTATVIR